MLLFTFSCVAGKWAEANFVLDDVFTCIKLMFHEFIQTEWNAVRQLEGEALNNQCMCYIRMGDYEMAERRARKCLEILQENVKGEKRTKRAKMRLIFKNIAFFLSALYRLGLCCNEQKKYEEAKKYLKYALCIKPDSLTIRDEYNRACKNIKDELLAVKKTWGGAFKRTNKLGDKEEMAKLKETSDLNAKLEAWERKKQEEQERLRNKRAANPKAKLGKGTVLTPEQIAMRYGARSKKLAKSKVPEYHGDDKSVKMIDYESLARRSENTLAEMGGPPRERRTRQEREFEKAMLGSRGGEPSEEDMELARYQKRFEEVKDRREKMQLEREREKRK